MINKPEYKCDGCGEWFTQQQMQMIACEGLYCLSCVELIQTTQEPRRKRRWLTIAAWIGLLNE